MTAFKTQQARWAKGLIQTSKKILPQVFRSDVPRPHQARSLLPPHGKSQLSAHGRVLGAAHAGHGHSLLSGLVPDVAHRRAALHGIDLLHLVLLSRLAEGAVSAHAGSKTFLYLPFLMSLGIGLTVTNTRAVLEALFGIKSSFKRTPKYRVEKTRRKSAGHEVPQAPGHCPLDRAADRLLLRPDHLRTPCSNENYFTIPFLLLFVVGYWYTGLLSLLAGPLRTLAVQARTWTSRRRSHSRWVCKTGRAGLSRRIHLEPSQVQNHRNSPPQAGHGSSYPFMS